MRTNSRTLTGLLRAFACAWLALLAGCGTLTGLPGHGGGKRFAVEQELVASATRGAIKQIDLSAICGKKVNLYVNAIGDTGAGNLTGGRFSIASQVRGDYLQAPATTARSVFPEYTQSTSSSSTTKANATAKNDETTTTNTSNSSTSAQSTTTSVLNAPERTVTQQEGEGGLAQIGMKHEGLGAYRTSEEITSDDLQYLTALLQTYLFLQGVQVVPPSEAELDLYITVDVFGTVRTRVDWLIANNEILRAKTSLEVMAVNSVDGTLAMAPQTACAEAEYNEQFILWTGPVRIRKSMIKSEPLLSDFTSVTDGTNELRPVSRDSAIPYPFRRQPTK